MTRGILRHVSVDQFLNIKDRQLVFDLVPRDDSFRHEFITRPRFTNLLTDAKRLAFGYPLFGEGFEPPPEKFPKFTPKENHIARSIP